MLLCELFQNKTLSPEFYAWFGDSKAVNADGSPMILYHGTSKDQDFKHFSIPKSGAWFATSPKDGSDYAQQNDIQNLVYDHMSGRYVPKHTASRVIPVYLKINNPKIYEGYPQQEIGHTQNYKKAAGIFFDKLRSEGYDSMIITHHGKPSVVALLVNDPSRIKSAISNKDYTHKKNIHEKASPASAIVKAVLKNPKFKKWFGKSKIVDHHGLPLVVYHGTASAFEAFEVASIGKVFSDDKHGFFFTNNTGEDMASGYAKNAAIKYKKNDNFDDVEYHGANVIPAFVKIENPYTWEDYMFAYDYDQPTDEKDYERKISYIMDGMSMIGWFDENKYAIVQQALDEGHDGIFLFDPTTDITLGKGNPTPENLVVAFRPDQIKSVFAKEFAPTDKLSEATDDWDLGGCWITNRGRVEDCDHKNDRHHSHIALDDFIDFIDPNEENEYDDYCRNAAVDMAYDEGWIRISTRGHRDFTVEWRSEPTAEAKQAIVKTVSSYRQQHFDNYELEVKGTFRQYNDFEMFFRDLRKSLRGDLLSENLEQPSRKFIAKIDSMISQFGGHVQVLLTTDIDPNTVEIDSITAEPVNSGWGGKAMSMICKTADQDGITLTLEVEHDEDDWGDEDEEEEESSIMKHDELVNFYQKFGFNLIDNDTHYDRSRMVRYPKNNRLSEDDSNVIYHVTPSKNVPSIMTHGLMPRVGRRSRKLGETPAIYFFPNIEAVDNALMNWLGDEFSENTRLALLQVSIPPNIDIHSDAGFECHITMPVTPDRIKVLTKNLGAVHDLNSLTEDSDVRYQNDGVFHDPDNKVVRDKGAWGASHSNSFAITGKSAAIMGADGYKDTGYIPAKTLAIKKLKAIVQSAGSKEPLYHGFQNRKHVKWEIGKVLTIPLTATAGDLQGTAGYGVRVDPNDNEGPPTVFEFPKGTKICGYSKWDKPDAEDFGHLWAEAIIAGKFRILSVRQVKYDGTWRDDVFLTVVRLEPVEYFDPETGSWTPASKLKEELSYDDLFGDKPVVDSLAAARMQKAVKARGFKPPALLTDDAPERRHIERVAAEHFPSKWEYQYTNWYPEPPFGAVESAGAGYYHTVLIDLPPRRGRPQQDERRIPASRGWFPTEQEVELRWEHDHPHDALSRNIKASLNVPKRPNLRVVESMQPRIELVHEKFSGIDDPDDYVYHVTTEPNARKILASGFHPSKPMMTNYAGYSKGKVFFTERPGVRFWQERVEAHAEHNFDDPPPVAVLRVPKALIQSELKPDEVGTRDSREQCYFIDKPFK